MKFHLVLISIAVSLAAARPLGRPAGVSLAVTRDPPAPGVNRRGLLSRAPPKTGGATPKPGGMPPAAPKTPAKPGAGTKPETPAAPKTGTAPKTPAPPKAPATPGTGTPPKTPATPKTSAKPGAGTPPKTPAAPKNSDTPKSPTTPGAGTTKTGKPKCKRGSNDGDGSGSECEATTPPAVKVPAMSMADCRAHLDANAGSKLLFWSAVAGQVKKAQKNAKDYPQLVGYKTLHDLLPGGYYDTYMAEMKAAKKANVAGALDDMTADDKFWTDCSQAFASIAQGTVYLFLPATAGSGDSWGTCDKSHWSFHEWPIICKSAAVTKLVRINAATGEEEDITKKMEDLRNTGKCPPLVFW
ncbi:hypothetical protein MAPG_01930 [Magnaporthiopsis poae ATCC 64411]|uniref:Uncharacterized protein n=1 Tax=Magnaporthiopsis poae (strain ATCC 64411 / 73-15) TaxID=644358 RepID=A0A0C4DPZ9_MAGP6|nr:hypothetical protein MAPG_01930 [Magnaporthiopsis poae ATCC 64411]